MTYTELWKRLTPLYDKDEAKSIARMVFEIRYGLSFSDLLMGRDTNLPKDELELLACRLEHGEPVQYVLGEAEFCGHRFCVEPGVLIPRPETQRICDFVRTWSVEHWTTIAEEEKQAQPGTLNILDIGTGSGCIACTIALDLVGNNVNVVGWDISDKALNVAARNAERLGAKVTFKKVDILTTQTSNPHPECRGITSVSNTLTPLWDVIVSNPPYVCEGEKKLMERNVLDWEPELALFVPDDDPLCFYRSIAKYAFQTLNEDGFLLVEINANYGDDTVRLMRDTGFQHVRIYTDQFDKDRFVFAQKKY